MHGLLRCNINAGVRTDVSLRDVTIAQMGNGATEWGWRHAPEARGRFWKSQLVELVLPWEKTVGFRLLAKARPEALWRVPHEMRGGGRWKSQNRKNVYLSPYVEEPLNSKVIKSTVPEVISIFRDPMFYVYVMNILMYVSRSRIWLWYRWKCVHGPCVGGRLEEVWTREFAEVIRWREAWPH